MIKRIIPVCLKRYGIYLVQIKIDLIWFDWCLENFEFQSCKMQSYHFKGDSFTKCIPVQYCDIMRFMVLHNRHHKVSQSVSFFMLSKTATILLRSKARGHFVMSITKTHESHYVGVLDNPHKVKILVWMAMYLGFWNVIINNYSMSARWIWDGK